jgi:hypothetical protein
MRRLILFLTLALAPLAAPAQTGQPAPDDGGTPARDGGTYVPDGGSDDSGGADRDNPEGDDNTGRVVTSCRTTQDCSPRFSCKQGTCRYSGVRDAERVGCLLGPQAALLVFGLSVVGVRRRKRKE